MDVKMSSKPAASALLLLLLFVAYSVQNVLKDERSISMALHKSVKLPRQILRRQLAQTEEEWDENEGEFEAGDYDGEDEAEFEAFDTDNAGEVFGSSKAQDGEDETEEYLGEFENTKSSSKVKSNDKTGSKKQSIFEDEAEDENENDTPQLVFDRDDEKKFEDTIKEEAHQKALKTGTNPAALASGTRNGTQNSTSNATSVLKSKDASKDTEERLTTKELEELEAEFEDDDEEEEDEEEQVLTLPVDESIQRAIDAHSVDPLPGKLTNTTNNTIANEHEKGTLETIQDLKGVVDEADLEDTLHIEKNAENKRLNDEESDRFGEGSDSVVDKSTQKVYKEEEGLQGGNDRNTSVFRQGMIMSGAFKDAVASPSSTTIRLQCCRVIAIVIAAGAGILVAWGSIVLWNRCRPANSGTLPKVIEIGAFTRKSPTYSKVKARSDEKPGSSDWQDWDDDWDDQGASLARRGNSVKQKRPQKWDDDW